MVIEKVCVRIPSEKKQDLLDQAATWRAEARTIERGPGWDAKVIHQIAKEKFGGLAAMFTHHGWPETGSDMMRYVQKHVKHTYGSVDEFVRRNG